MERASATSQAERIVGKFTERFGSFVAASDAIGVPVNSLNRWRASGDIRRKHWRKILRAAVLNDVPVTPHDFVADLDEVYQELMRLKEKADRESAASVKELEGAA
jgi:hypothetical protein